MMSHSDGPVTISDRASTCEHNATLSSVSRCEEHSGQWTWKQSYTGLKHQQQTLRHTRTDSFEDVYSIAASKARASRLGSNFETNFKVIARPSFKRMHSLHNTSTQLGFSEDRAVVDEAKEAGSISVKNLMSECIRRKKLNDRIYTLRAVVPNIGKNLQSQVDKIQEDIVDLESTRKEGPAAAAGSGDEDPKRNNSVVGYQKRVKMEHQIVELEVSQMEEHIYHLRIHCKKTPGVLVQLTRAVEALELEVLNANISSVDDHILNSVVVEVKNGSVMKSEELRDMTREVAPKFGFSFC